MRLDKYLSYALSISRKEAKKLIKDNEIIINKQVINDSGYYVDVDNDIIIYKDQEINYEQFIYLMLNKPSGVISATTDNFHQTVLDLLDPQLQKRGLFPVGRLDIDTEGLLFLTNNGKLAHYLTSPNHQVKKMYYVKVNGKLNDKDVETFLDGMNIKDGHNNIYKTRPAELKIIETGDFSTAHVVITEGKFHQIKRMFNYVEKEVVYLKRVMMKGISLDPKLSLGEFRPLTKKEISIIKEGFNL